LGKGLNGLSIDKFRIFPYRIIRPMVKDLYDIAFANSLFYQKDNSDPAKIGRIA